MIKVQAVQYPHVITEDGKRIPIAEIKDFISAPCFIEQVDTGYKVVTEGAAPPEEGCST